MGKFCTKCGSPVDGSGNLCFACAKACGQVNFCFKCGAPIDKSIKICPTCAAEYDQEKKQVRQENKQAWRTAKVKYKNAKKEQRRKHTGKWTVQIVLKICCVVLLLALLGGWGDYTRTKLNEISVRRAPSRHSMHPTLLPDSNESNHESESGGTDVEEEELPIIVSLGDSYSSGEGIEPFYDQNKSDKNKVQSADWLAHRSEKSWPGMLRFPGLTDAVENYKGENWFFVAASGAETKHLKNKQPKSYSRGEYEETTYLAPQLDIFKKLEANSVDYVTLTLGGNDAHFAEIIEVAVMGTSLNLSGLEDLLSDVWDEFYAKGGIRDNLYNAYKDIEKAAGTQAQIIVVGYPTLLDQNGGGVLDPIHKDEAAIINQAVRNFNIEIEKIVDQCAAEGMKICFVSVEEAFDGHEAYSENAYINEVYLLANDEELKDFVVASSYSMHPNYKGAVEYAKCVNAKIEQLVEEEEARFEQEATNPSPKDREIVLVLNSSGSMSGIPMQETKTAAHTFVNKVLENEANVGIVAYDDNAKLCAAISDSRKYLDKAINLIEAGGGTNIEAGLAMADSMLQNSTAEQKIIILMSDGEPNEGKVGEELIAYANELKEKGYSIYTLGFFSETYNRYSVQSLMDEIASGQSYHYEVTDADILKFFFGDIADQINGTKYFYIRIACPVDVTVEYNGETMTSRENYLSVRTSFGTMTFEENPEEAYGDNDTRVKILRLKEGANYDVRIAGNGTGSMQYTISFMNQSGEYSDVRTFENVKITRQTKIETVVSVGSETYMYVDEDGDGEHDITYKALTNGKAEIVDYTYLLYISIAILFFLLSLGFILVMVRRSKIKQYLSNV